VDTAREITLATRQQATGVDQVSEAMRNIDQGMKETVEGIQQTNAAASQLASLGLSLQELVRKFHVSDSSQSERKPE
jgi:methyl-accepting chemotaxis protein